MSVIRHEYPKYKYHLTSQARVVSSEMEEKSLGDGWADSPSDFGIETCPGIDANAEIAGNKQKAPGIKRIEKRASGGGDA